MQQPDDYSSPVIIKVENVGMDFKVAEESVSVLKRVSFTIHDNTFNIIYGPSGSGKSTLLNIITGLQKPSFGHVGFEGKPLYSYSPDELARFRAHRVGIVYQQNYWVRSLNVLENISIPLYFLGYSKQQAAELAEIALERVDMVGYAQKDPTLLSGGEQQRIAMARALVNDPKIVIADEPTGSLDSKNGDLLMAMLHKVKTEYRRTVILVTHNMEYLPLADNLLHIKDGELTELKNDSINKATQLLMKDMKLRIESFAKFSRQEASS